MVDCTQFMNFRRMASWFRDIVPLPHTRTNPDSLYSPGAKLAATAVCFAMYIGQNEFAIGRQTVFATEMNTGRFQVEGFMKRLDERSGMATSFEELDKWSTSFANWQIVIDLHI